MIELELFTEMVDKDPGSVLQDFSPPDPEDCPPPIQEQETTQEPSTSQGEIK